MVLLRGCKALLQASRAAGAVWEVGAALGAHSRALASAASAAAERASSGAADVLIVGAGHNGLVAATLLARQGLNVDVYEEMDVVGGACRTEHPFTKAPGLPQSTGTGPHAVRSCTAASCPTGLPLRPRAGAYLLGVMPPELLQLLELDLPLRRRSPHYFLPSPAGGSGRYLLLGGDEDDTRAQLTRFFSQVGGWVGGRPHRPAAASADRCGRSARAFRPAPSRPALRRPAAGGLGGAPGHECRAGRAA